MSTPSVPTESKIHRARIPRIYTEEQLVFLRQNLGEFERKSQGPVRGDAKKFALDLADEFVVRYGLPSDADTSPGVDTEAKFREQIYNWFKNTVGRSRRKLEGKSRSAKKSPEQDTPLAGPSISWHPNLATPNVIPYSEGRSSLDPASASQSLAPIPYVGPRSGSSRTGSGDMSVDLNVAAVRDAILTPSIDASTLSTMIQRYATSLPSPTSLTTVVHALFDAIATAEAQSPPQTTRLPPNSPPHALLRRFLDACSFFPATVIHAGVAGPDAGARALQMQLRKCSIWVPNSPALARPSTITSSSMTDEMQRIAADRQRRKDFIQWARMHGAALELGVMGDVTTDSARAFAEMVARDSVWELEEVEWVAGVCVLRSLVRTAAGGNAGRRNEYGELFKAYEGRWKEIRDEGRQELFTEMLLDTKQGLMILDDRFGA